MMERGSILWLVLLGVIIIAAPCAAEIQYNDGGTYDIATTINDNVWVDWETPGMGTTVNVLAGGEIPI